VWSKVSNDEKPKDGKASFKDVEKKFFDPKSKTAENTDSTAGQGESGLDSSHFEFDASNANQILIAGTGGSGSGSSGSSDGCDAGAGAGDAGAGSGK